MKYTMDTTMGELLNIPEVRAVAEKLSPKLTSDQVLGFISGLTLQQLSDARKEAAPLVKALLATANGEAVDLSALDPSGKKPVLNAGPFGSAYDPADVDGKLYMLDHRLSGCVSVGFSKAMDESVKGHITYAGKEVPFLLTTVAIGGGLQFLGIFVRDICTEYSTSYTFHVEGFQDTDGNVMDPADLVVKTVERGVPDPAYQAHDAVALEAAEEGIVLLKNDHALLPLKKDQKLALIGAENFRLEAVGAGKINPRYKVRLLDAVKESSFRIADAGDPDAVAVIVISRASGENYDNGPFAGQYYLTDSEKAAIGEAKAKYGHIVALINSGYPMDVSWTKDDAVEAVLWTGFAGMLGGQAVVDILNGTVNPSGKLPDTWALDYYDIPSSKNFYVPESPDKALDADHDVWIDTVYEEDIYVGYRYFDTFHKEVAYPFGYGLSYTTFALDSSFEKAADTAADGEKALAGTVKVTVTNTGDTAGKEVVQAYAGIPDGKLEQPDKRLAGFAKTDLLAPGASQTLEIPVFYSDLSSYDEDRHAYVMEPGTYTILVGTSVADTKEAGSFALAEDVVRKVVGDYMKPPAAFTRLSKKDPEGTYPKGEKSGILEGVHSLQHTEKRSSIAVPEKPYKDIDLSSWSDEDLARISVCASSGWGMQDTGVAGRMYRIEGKDIPAYAVADGNNGVNINKPNIGMPTSNLVAATWNRDLACKVGTVIGEEAKENDVQMILAPAMNIHRNPLCGRQPEYFSEDPLLSGTMAGYQLKGLEESGTDGCVKHVCCNNAESSRKRNHSIVSQRALREIYLRNFAIAFRVHQPAGIMTAYNACNGVFTAADEELIEGIFRGELGFQGVVMTDWNSYDTADVAEAAEAGNCWFTPGTTDDAYTSRIVKGLQDGTVTRSRLEDNVRHLLSVIRK